MRRRRGYRSGVAVAGVSVLLLTACSNNDSSTPEEDEAQAGGDTADALSVEEAQQVLLPFSALPGTIEDSGETFDDTPGFPEREELDATLADQYGGHECVAVLEDFAIDGENTPEAFGLGWANLDPESVDDATGPYPGLQVSVTSYEQEASVDEYWDRIQETCDGEVITEDTEEPRRISLEQADFGEFRGLRETWERPDDDAPEDTSGYIVSMADGHDVIQFRIGDVSDETVEELMDQQLQLLQDGPEESTSDAEAAPPNERDLPEDALSPEELEGLLLTTGEFPFHVVDVDTRSGPERMQSPNEWDYALMGAVTPIAPRDATDVDSEDGPVTEGGSDDPACLSFWHDGDDSLFSGDSDAPAALATARAEPSADGGEEGPPGAAVLLQSDQDETTSLSYEAEWQSFLAACGGEWEMDAGTQHLSPLDIEGVSGYTARLDSRDTGDDSADDASEEALAITSHMAHLEFGHNSMRVIGLGIDEGQMRELVEAQLDKLESAG